MGKCSCVPEGNSMFDDKFFSELTDDSVFFVSFYGIIISIMQIRQNSRGFTIVELLIVIVVIAVLASIVIVTYKGVQARAQQSKISHDLRDFEKAIRMARAQSGQVLGNITGSFGTASGCIGHANGTDLATLPKTDSCWTRYASALDKISIASGVNIRELVDPWGRPYYLDENEYEGGSTNCTKDHLGSFQVPFVSSWTAMSGTDVWVPNIMTNC